MHDEDDLRQELLAVAVHASSRTLAEKGGGTAYIRESVRNAIKKLHRAAYAQRRCPTNQYGVAIPLTYGVETADTGVGPESLAVLALDAHTVRIDDPESLALLAHGARAIRKRLCGGSRRVLGCLLAGRAVGPNRIERLCEEIQKLGGAMQDPYEILEPPPGETPNCHADGVEPEGYDPKETMCQDCQDKFTCLPHAVAKGLPVAKKTAGYGVEIDVEVGSVLARTMTYRDAVARIARRAALRDVHKPVPADLWPLAPEKPASAPPAAPAVASAPPATPPAAAPAQASPGPRKVLRKKAAEAAPPAAAAPTPAPKPVKAPKPAKAPKTKPAKAAKAPKAAKPKRAPKPAKAPNPEGRKSPIRALCPAKTLDAKGMSLALGRVRLGREVALDVGYQLVKRKADGSEHVVTIRANGFEFGGVIYDSLTACAGHACNHAYRSGNDYFSLLTSKRTEVRDPKGKVIARGGE